jgi:hypothetical protein
VEGQVLWDGRKTLLLIEQRLSSFSIRLVHERKLNIDKPGCDDQACSIDGPGGWCVDARREALARVSADCDISAVPRLAASVDQTAVPDHEVVGCGLALGSQHARRDKRNRQGNN